MEPHPDIDSLLDEDDVSAQLHLRSCPRCRINLRIYRTSFHETVKASPEDTVEDVPLLSDRDVSERYTRICELGRGGMGVVWRVYDQDLQRTVALKMIRNLHQDDPTVSARFIAEARVAARLQHPGIVPIYDIGHLPSGHLYFTMKEVRGETLLKVIHTVHDNASPHEWRLSADGWSFRRAVDAFHQICVAACYAHSQGVLHRDLKPSNVMVGEFGEVQVLDWGLVKALPGAGAGTEGLAAQTMLEQTMPEQTILGQINGTPSYMSPEQARGETLDERSDIYALGAILYYLLAGQPPFRRPSSKETLRDLQQMTPIALSQRHQRPIPAALDQIWRRAMARDPADRFKSATEMAGEVRAWLDGLKARQRGQAVLTEALTAEPSIQALRSQATALRQEAAALLDGVSPWASEQDKADGWACADKADALEREATLARLDATRKMHAALTHSADLLSARKALARQYLSDLHQAEARGDTMSALRATVYLSAQTHALPASDPDRAHYMRWLQGDGALTLHTSPPGARVTLLRYRHHRRRLIAEDAVFTGTTPLAAVPLAMGSYLAIIEHDQCETVRYPIFIQRGEHWDGIPPDQEHPAPIALPPRGSLRADEVYIPAGWFISGGDPDAINPRPASRRWVDAVVMARFPVTNRRYIQCLDQIAREQGLEVAMSLAPCNDAAISGERGPPIYGWSGSGFYLRPDQDGDLWHPDWPVLQVDYHAATSWVAAYAKADGHPWRLPRADEWEKAARGTDGRAYVWGDWLDPSWCCMRQSQEGTELPAPVDSFPIDTSPYGVRGMNGNCREWTVDHFEESAEHAPTETQRVICGGSWIAGPRGCRLAGRDWVRDTWRNGDQGLRMVRRYPTEAP